MTRLNSSIAPALLILASIVSAAASDSAAPPAASPAIYLTQSEIARLLQAAIDKPADPALATIGATDTYQIHEVHRGHTGQPAIHPVATELHFILDGSATFVTGGVIKKLPGNGGSVVEGGTSRSVRQGDAIIVPPNTPHWYSKVDGSLTYLEVRWVTPQAAPAAQ